MKSNFDFLNGCWPELSEIGRTAESYLYSDPNACIFKLGLLAERMVGRIIDLEKLTGCDELTQAERLNVLRREGVLPRNVDDMFFAIRKARNDAVHTGISSEQDACTLLRMAHHLCVWFMEVYGNWEHKSAPFVLPARGNEADTAEPDVSSETSSAPLALSEEEKQYLQREQIRLESSILPFAHYALQQNGIPLIRSLLIINNSPRALEHADIYITSVPEVALPLTLHVEYVPPGNSYEVKDIRLPLNAQYLADVSGTTSGLIRMELKQDDASLFVENTDIAILAPDRWHGTSCCTELIASFAVPNQADIAVLCSEAARLMHQRTGDPSLDGYQSHRPERIFVQAAAVYDVLKSYNIVYSARSASLSQLSQPIRSCNTLLAQKLGSDLDIALLYASCIEAAGLHALLLLGKRVLCGVWLDNLTFPEAVQDDAAALCERLAEGELLVLDPSLCVSGKNTSFEESQAAALPLLSDQVEYIIDIARARAQGISALNTHAPKADMPQSEAPAAGPEVISRKAAWERKLLDLSTRNALLNMRPSRVLPLLTSSAEAFSGMLYPSSQLLLIPAPEEWPAFEQNFDFEALSLCGSCLGTVRSELDNHRLCTAFSEGNLLRTAKALYRAARTALEESGSNTLYLALGMLRWYEQERSSRPHYAPLLLVPVDILRKSGTQGYALRIRDEEMQPNVTLLEMLHQDFDITVSGLDPLPAGKRGPDVKKVFSLLAQAVASEADWSVIDSVCLGTFSFSQFVMWNDLRNHSQVLEKNKIVRSLLDGKLAWEAHEMNIGSRVSEGRALLPLPADASQLFAIDQACRGESFVLHGPPGTGKSQTITGLIANALSQGRTVLFVAEKTAALEVVQRRLDRIGLSPFCLELHSGKARKKDVLEQLKSACEVTRLTSGTEYAQRAEQIAALRSELDSYAAALHKPLPCGLSVYELIGQCEICRNAPDIAPFDDSFAPQLTRDMLERAHTLLAQLTAVGREIGHPHNHPLTRVGLRTYSAQLRKHLREALASYENSLSALQKAVSSFAALLSLPASSALHHPKSLCAIATELPLWLELPACWAENDNLEALSAHIRQIIRLSQHAGVLRTRLLSRWQNEFLDLPGEELLAEYREAARKWFLGKVWALNSLSTQLLRHSKSDLNRDMLENQLQILVEYQKSLASAEVLVQRIVPQLGPLFKGGTTNWTLLARIADSARDSAARLHQLTGSDELRRRCAALDRQTDCHVRLLNAWKQTSDAQQPLYSLLNAAPSAAADWINEELQLCSNLHAHADDLKTWITWNNLSDEAAQAGLTGICTAYRDGLAHDNVIPAFRKAAFSLLLRTSIDADPVLGNFSGAVFNEKIERFRQMDHEFMQLTRQEIYCRLAARVPNFTLEAAHNSELSILQRAIRSGGRGLSIRRLFDQIPTLLARLCPCMLMSPLSAAQYLDINREPFDIVVFDEASQLPTCKAVGVLARGKNAVIVGDPKQMPPTAFFASGTPDEENPDAEDLESILDDCLALNMPQTHLLWHYRSRHESLIAFSNQRFYENRLCTFPSPDDIRSRVNLVRVKGVFERGKARVNRAEAKAVVDELIRRSKDEALCRQSVGVVTFNVAQRNLIEDLFTEACRTDTQLEQWAQHTDEPLFIKNLENVQGDERDVILFSIGYGPDENGRVSMNFGPLNRAGGWRRLNVAVSRARCEMTVYATLTPEQINLSRSGAQGTAALKAFLEYAASGRMPHDGSSARTESALPAAARSLEQALRERGWDVHTNIGRSRHRIDLGVVNPDDPGRYLLGIMLDGPAYRSCRTTRDREIAQLSVLNGLGWNIHRVWSADWIEQKQREPERIVALLEKMRIAPPPAPAPLPEWHAPAADQLLSASPAEEALSLPEPVPAPPVSNLTFPKAPFYLPTALAAYPLTPQELMTPMYSKLIRARLSAVLRQEAPLSRSLLLQRVLDSFSVSKADDALLAHLSGILDGMEHASSVCRDTAFCWKNAAQRDSYLLYRSCGPDEPRRDIRHVPTEEIINVLCVVLCEQIGLSETDLMRETARKLGYPRLGGAVSTAISDAVLRAFEQKLISAASDSSFSLSDEGLRRAQAICHALSSAQ